MSLRSSKFEPSTISQAIPEESVVDQPDVEHYRQLFESNRAVFTSERWEDILEQAVDPDNPADVEKALMSAAKAGDERAKKFREDYLQLRHTTAGDVAKSYTKPITLKLGEEWEGHTSYKQAQIRSQRARAGVKCEKCGRVGFWRSNCPVCSVQDRKDAAIPIRPEFLSTSRRSRLAAAQPGGVAYDTEFGLWASLIMDIALDSDGDGRAGIRQVTRFLDETYHAPQYAKFDKWLAESRAHQLVEVEYDSKGALTAEDLEEALHDYHRWYHQTDKLVLASVEPANRNWFWGNASRTKEADLEGALRTVEKIERRERRATRREERRRARLKRAAEQGTSGKGQQEKRDEASDDDDYEDDSHEDDEMSDEYDNYDDGEIGEAKPTNNASTTRRPFGEIGGPDDYRPQNDPLLKAMAAPGGVAAQIELKAAESRAKKGSSSMPFEAVDTSSKKTAAAITAKKSTMRVAHAAATPVQEVMAYFRSLSGAPGVDSKGNIQGAALKSFRSTLAEDTKHVERSEMPTTSFLKPAIEIPESEHGMGSTGNWTHKHKARRFPHPPLISAELRASDQSLLSYEARPFKPRDGMEENFQSVMRRLAHIMHGEINRMVPDFAGSILREPRETVHSRFFPDGVWEEHRDYLVTQLERPEQMTKNHEFRGNFRSTDDMVYFGDRRPQHGRNAAEARRGELKVMYEPKKGSLQSLHSSIAWRNVLSKHDEYATSGKQALEESKRMATNFKKQGQWVNKQRGLLEQKRARMEHLLYLLNDEIKKDAARELKTLDLRVDARQRRRLQADAAKERAETADRIMRILQEYGIISGDEMSDYLLYTVRQIADVTGTSVGDLKEGADKSMIGKASDKIMSKAKLKAKEKARTRQAASLDSGFKKKVVKRRERLDPDVDRFNWESATGKAASKKKTTQQRSRNKSGEEGSDGRAMRTNPNAGMYDANGRATGVQSVSGPLKSVGLYTPSVESYRPLQAGHPDVEKFERAGLSAATRTGDITDTTQTPAIVSLPDALYTGADELEASDDMPRTMPKSHVMGPGRENYARMFSARGAAPVQEKSYLANKIFEELRGMQFDPVTGQVTREDVPLFHRVTDEPANPAGSRQYAATMGRAFKSFLPDDKTTRTFRIPLEERPDYVKPKGPKSEWALGVDESSSAGGLGAWGSTSREEEAKLVAAAKKKAEKVKAHQDAQKALEATIRQNRGGVDNSSSQYFVSTAQRSGSHALQGSGGSVMSSIGSMQQKPNGPRPGAVAIFQAGGAVDDKTSRSIGRSRGGWGTGRIDKAEEDLWKLTQKKQMGGKTRGPENAATSTRLSTGRRATPQKQVPRVLSETQIAMIQTAKAARLQQLDRGGEELEVKPEVAADA